MGQILQSVESNGQILQLAESGKKYIIIRIFLNFKIQKAYFEKHTKGQTYQTK